MSTPTPDAVEPHTDATTTPAKEPTVSLSSRLDAIASDAVWKRAMLFLLPLLALAFLYAWRVVSGDVFLVLALPVGAAFLASITRFLVRPSYQVWAYAFLLMSAVGAVLQFAGRDGAVLEVFGVLMGTLGVAGFAAVAVLKPVFDHPEAADPLGDATTEAVEAAAEDGELEGAEGRVGL